MSQATKPTRVEYVGGPCCGMAVHATAEPVLILEDPVLPESRDRDGRPAVARGRFRYARQLDGQYWYDGQL